MKQALNKVKTRFWGTSLFRNRLLGETSLLVRNKILGKEAQQAFGGRSFFLETSFWGTCVFIFLKQAFGEETFFLVEQALFCLNKLLGEHVFWGRSFVRNKLLGGNKPFFQKQALNKEKEVSGEQMFLEAGFLENVRNKLFQKETFFRNTLLGNKLFQKNKLEKRFWGRTFVSILTKLCGEEACEEAFFLVEQVFFCLKQVFGGTCLLGKKLC